MKAFSANIYKRSLPRWPSYTCASGNRLAWDASETATNLYAYDGAGRLTNHVVNGQTRTFAYNFQGRMTSLTDIDGSVFAYEFDGEGNRLSQALNDCLSKRFVYDGADVLLELTPANAVAYAWIDGPGIDQPIERLLYIGGAPRARRVFHADALGSVAALTGPGGHVTQTYAYSAFGSLRSSSGPDLNRVTYTAREHLGDSQGWMYYRHRVYLSSLGRFSSGDPLGFAEGPSIWCYVGCSPIGFRDPFGLQRPSWFPRDFSGIGTIQNTTTHDFDCAASQGQHGPMTSISITPGTWGGNNPMENLDDIDFIFPTPQTPINGRTNGAFKIGSNDSTLIPDPSTPSNSLLDDYNSYWGDERARELPGYPH